VHTIPGTLGRLLYASTGVHVGFMWRVTLGGVSFLLEGGYLDTLQDRWIIWADWIDPYTVNRWHNPEATPTEWHPDWPVWEKGLTQLDLRYRPQKAPKHTLLDSAHALPLSEGQGRALLCGERQLPCGGDTLPSHCGRGGRVHVEVDDRDSLARGPDFSQIHRVSSKGGAGGDRADWGDVVAAAPLRKSGDLCPDTDEPATACQSARGRAAGMRRLGRSWRQSG